jgi:hypothetical protein
VIAHGGTNAHRSTTVSPILFSNLDTLCSRYDKLMPILFDQHCHSGYTVGNRM